MMLMQEGSICFVFKKLGSHSIVGIEVTEQSLSLIHFILLELAFTNTIGIYPQQKIKPITTRFLPVQKALASAFGSHHTSSTKAIPSP